MSDLPELYFAADVEADGPIPGLHSMLRPISDDFDSAARARWHGVNAPHLVALVRAGSWF